MAETENNGASEATPAKRRRTRGVVAMTLVVIASILLPAACITVWVRNVVLSTNRYVDTVGPLGDDPAVQQALAARVTTAVVDAVDLEDRARDALPKRAQFLAGPIAAGGEQLVGTLASKAVESDAFPKLWKAINRVSHDQVVAAITGRDSEVITNDDGQVVLNLRPLAEQVAAQLSRVAPGFPTDIPLERANLRYVLVDSDELASVQSYTRLLDRLAWAVPALALILYGAAIAVAPNRRRGVIWVGLGIAVAMMVTLVAYGFGRTLYLDGLPATANQDAASAVYDTVTRFFERALRMLLVLGLVVAAIAWVSGPASGAVAVRRQWRRLGAGRAEADGEPGPVPVWVAAHTTGLRVGVLVLLAVLLFAWERPTGLVVLGLAVLGLLALAAIQIVGAGGTRGTGAAGTDSSGVPA